MDIYPNILAVGESTLTKRQKELGVVVVDMGSSSTNVAVYEEGALIYAGVLPIGGEHVTSDLALGNSEFRSIQQKNSNSSMVISLFVTPNEKITMKRLISQNSQRWKQ